MSEEFERKVIQELHDIALSLKAMSGRNVVSVDDKKTEPRTYAEKYFSRSIAMDKENEE